MCHERFQPTLVLSVAHAQCNTVSGDGACPDNFVSGGDETVEASGSFASGLTSMSFKRPLVTGDPADLDTPSDGDMYIVWAMGRLGVDRRVTKHSERLSGTCAQTQSHP